MKSLVTDRAELARYLEQSKTDATLSRAAYVSGINLMSDDPYVAAGIMRDISDAYKKAKHPLYHIMVSFGSRDAQDLPYEKVEAVARRFMVVLEIPHHYGLLIAHEDRNHNHFHLAIDRRDPVTNVIWEEPHLRRLQYACRLVERHFGLQEVRSTLAKLPDQEWAKRDETMSTGVRRARFRTLELVNEGLPEAEHRELRLEEEPYLIRVREALKPYFLGTLPSSWRELESDLGERGYRLVRSRSGFAITDLDGKEGAAAGEVSGFATMPKLELHFGISYADHLENERARVLEPKAPSIGRAASAKANEVDGPLFQREQDEPAERQELGEATADDRSAPPQVSGKLAAGSRSGQADGKLPVTAGPNPLDDSRGRREKIDYDLPGRHSDSHAPTHARPEPQPTAQESLTEDLSGDLARAGLLPDTARVLVDHINSYRVAERRTELDSQILKLQGTVPRLESLERGFQKADAEAESAMGALYGENSAGAQAKIQQFIGEHGIANAMGRLRKDPAFFAKVNPSTTRKMLVLTDRGRVLELVKNAVSKIEIAASSRQEYDVALGHARESYELGATLDFRDVIRELNAKIESDTRHNKKLQDSINSLRRKAPIDKVRQALVSLSPNQRLEIMSRFPELGAVDLSIQKGRGLSR